MRPVIFILLILVVVCSNSNLCAQNLIPNPGFEESTNGRVNLWIQPQGEYYHYSSNLFIIDGAPTLVSTNALHIGNTLRGTEYMYIRLTKPLKKGVTYCAKMKVKMPSLNKSEAEVIKSLGWSWFDEEPDVVTRTFLNQIPDIDFTVAGLNIYDDFIELSQPYTAVGGEQLLVIGKFFGNVDHNSIDAAKAMLFEWQATYAQIKQQSADSFMQLYPPLPDYTQIKSERKIRKLFAGITSQISAISYQKQLFDDSLKMVYQPTIDSLNALLFKSVKPVDILTYFDDFCLTPQTINGSCACSDKPQVGAFALGETYRLNGVNFETDKYNLNREAMHELDILLALLIKNPTFKVSILGHTDNRAKDDYNQKLSENRSKACADYLIAKGVVANRVSWQGFGASKPLASNDSEEGQAINRRVEFVLDN